MEKEEGKKVEAVDSLDGLGGFRRAEEEVEAVDFPAVLGVFRRVGEDGEEGGKEEEKEGLGKMVPQGPKLTFILFFMLLSQDNL